MTRRRLAVSFTHYSYKCRIDLGAQENVKPWVDGAVGVTKPKTNKRDIWLKINLNIPCLHDIHQMDHLWWEPTKGKNGGNYDEHPNHSPL